MELEEKTFPVREVLSVISNAKDAMMTVSYTHLVGARISLFQKNNVLLEQESPQTE